MQGESLGYTLQLLGLTAQESALIFKFARSCRDWICCTVGDALINIRYGPTHP